MHSAVDKSSPTPVDDAARVVVSAFVDSFFHTPAVDYGTRRALQRLIEQASATLLWLEETIDVERDEAVRLHYVGVRDRLFRLRIELEQVLLME